MTLPLALSLVMSILMSAYILRPRSSSKDWNKTCEEKIRETEKILIMVSEFILDTDNVSVLNHESLEWVCQNYNELFVTYNEIVANRDYKTYLKLEELKKRMVLSLDYAQDKGVTKIAAANSL